MSDFVFRSNRKKFEKDFKEALQTGLAAVGAEAETNAKREETMVDTGRLRNSITWATKERGGHAYTYQDDSGAEYTDVVGAGAKEGEVWIGTNVYYAVFIEMGVRGRPGLYFLRKACQNYIERYKEILESALKALKD